MEHPSLSAMQRYIFQKALQGRSVAIAESVVTHSGGPEK
jgi:hypothetical protein